MADSRLIVTYKVTSQLNIPIFYLENMTYTISSVFSKVECNGVDITSYIRKSNQEVKYAFPSTGDYTLYYTLVDNTKLPNILFYGITEATSVVMPDTITEIGNSCFNLCENVTSYTL